MRATRTLALCVSLGAMSTLGVATPATGQQQFPVAARDIPRGAVLSAIDLLDQAVPAGETSPVGAGWITRRLVRAGEPLRPPAVEPPRLVERGAAVEIRGASGAALITVRGTALGHGALGDRVLVRVGTGWTLEGVVDGPGTLVLNGARGSGS
jgi:flagellar basal body P-ring formation protein FlgA